MAEPAITVVVPTYNRASSLARLLDALADCEEPAGGVEVVVVDDGSTDGTAEVVGRSRVSVRYVRQSNRGPAAARNAGWSLARSPIVAFTDDDTLPDRRWLVDMVEELRARPELVAVGGNILPMRRGFLADLVQLDRLVGHGADDGGVRFVITANAAWRLHALRAVDGFDEQFPIAAGEDADISYRAVENGGRLGITPRATVFHDHRTSLRGLFRTYYRHGTARPRLAATNAGLGLGPATRAILSPAYWTARFRYYREAGAAPSRAAAYCALRATGLACFLAGVATAGRRRVTPEEPDQMPASVRQPPETSSSWARRENVGSDASSCS